MNLYYEKKTDQLVLSRGGRPIQRLETVSGGVVRILLGFIDEPGVVALPRVNREIWAGILAKDGPILALAVEWELNKTTNQYEGFLVMSTQEMADAMADNDEIEAHFQVIWRAGNKGPFHSQVVDITIERSAINFDDIAPTLLPDASYWLGLRAVRFDVDQDLSGPQQAQARANMGAIGEAELDSEIQNLQDQITGAIPIEGYVPEAVEVEFLPQPPHEEQMVLGGSASTAVSQLNDILDEPLIVAPVDSNGHKRWSTDGLVAINDGVRFIISAGSPTLPAPWLCRGTTGTGVSLPYWSSTSVMSPELGTWSPVSGTGTLTVALELANDGDFVPGQQIDFDGRRFSLGADDVIREYALLEEGVLPDSQLPGTLAKTVDLDAEIARASGAEEFILDELESIQSAYTVGRIGKQTLALLEADLEHDADVLAEVTNDPDPGANGAYIKIGASGTGSWLKSSNDLSGRVSNAENRIETIDPSLSPDRLTVSDPSGHAKYLAYRSDVDERIEGSIANDSESDKIRICDPDGYARQIWPAIVPPEAIAEKLSASVRFDLVPDIITISDTNGNARQIWPSKFQEAKFLARTPAQDIISVVINQSNGFGSDAKPSLSTTQPYLNVTFSPGGPRFEASDGSRVLELQTGYMPLIAMDNTDDGGESSIVEACNSTVRLVVEENNIPHTQLGWRMVGVNAAIPARSIAMTLADWDSFALPAINKAKSFSAAEGRTHEIGPVIIWQGEGDQFDGTVRATYLNSLLAMRDKVVALVGSQPNPPPFLLVQTTDQVGSYIGSHTDYIRIPLAQWDAFRMTKHLPCPIIIVAGWSMFPTSPTGGTVHVSNVGQKWAGGYIAKAYKRRSLDGLPWLPLHPTHVEVSGLTVTVHLHVPYPPAVLQNGGNFGFRVDDASGATVLSDFTIVDGTKVRFTLNRALAANAILMHGVMVLDNPSSFGGAMVGVRDSDPMTVSVSGVNRPLYAQLIAFDWKLN